MTIDKDKLKALAEAAIEGPWHLQEEHESSSFQGYMVVDPWRCPVADFGTSNQEAKNAEFIAAANPAAVLALLAEIDQLKAENEALRVVMSAVTSEIPSGKFIQPGNAPGHCHDIPGVWDRGNGEKSGKECGWCKVWNAAIAMSKQSTIKKMGDSKGTISHA